MKRLTIAWLMFCGIADVSFGSPIERPVDCITNAAIHHGVSDIIVRAIIYGESRMNPKAINKNANGTIDIGAAQTNSSHFESLKKLGVHPEHLKDGCVSAYVGAWMYAKEVARVGNTWEAVGSYHSRTPIFQQAYANSVAITLAKWGQIEKGWLPYPNAPKSSSEAQRIVKGQRSSNIHANPKAGQRYSSTLLAISE